MEERTARGGIMEGEQAAEAENEQEKDLNELLRNNAGLQSQFDKMVGKALNTARSHWEREQGEADERAARARDGERERALNEREQALGMRERRAATIRSLGERGLPIALTECLNLASDESMTQGLDALEKAFAQEVRKAVEERLKGTPLKSGGEAAYASQMRAALGLK